MSYSTRTTWYCMILSLTERHISLTTRSSAIAEGPRNASCQLKFASCHATVQKLLVRQVLNKSKLKRYSKAMCNKHVHSTMTRLSRFRCPVGVINKQTTIELWISPVYRRLAVAKLSPQCRNCSDDPDLAHLGNTHSSQDWDFAWPTRVQNLKSLALAVAEKLHGV